MYFFWRACWGGGVIYFIHFVNSELPFPCRFYRKWDKLHSWLFVDAGWTSSSMLLLTVESPSHTPQGFAFTWYPAGAVVRGACASTCLTCSSPGQGLSMPWFLCSFERNAAGGYFLSSCLAQDAATGDVIHPDNQTSQSNQPRVPFNTSRWRPGDPAGTR